MARYTISKPLPREQPFAFASSAQQTTLPIMASTKKIEPASLGQPSTLSASSKPTAPLTTAVDASTDAPETEHKTGFMDLPVEVRTQIYGYLLIEDDPVSLIIHPIPGRFKTQGRDVIRSGSKNRMWRHKTWNAKLRSWQGPEPEVSSVLYINRTVFQEAVSTLYGSNTFIFERITVLQDFLQSIGNRSQHLRHLRIGSKGYVKSRMRDTIKLLCSVPFLRTLEFAHYDLCCGKTFRNQSKMTIQQLAKDCAPLARSLKKSYEAGKLKGNILDVFCVWVPRCMMCRDSDSWGAHKYRCGYLSDSECECNCSEEAEKNKQLQETFRKEIAKYL